MEYLKINNWERWQSYRGDRGQPPWIKIHRRILRNPEWISLTDNERGQLVSLWILAADKEGSIPNSPALLQKICFMSKKPNLTKFIELGFIQHNGIRGDVNMTSTRRQDVAPKAEENRIEKDKNRVYMFDQFWEAYPKKEGKGQALKAWDKIKNYEEILPKILYALSWQTKLKNWNKDNGQFIPMPSSYLNNLRWEDKPSGNKTDDKRNDNPFLLPMED